MAFLMMGLNGIFAILAAVGGGSAMYILVVVFSILFGKKREGAAEPDGAPAPKPQKQMSGACRATARRAREATCRAPTSWSRSSSCPSCSTTS